MNTRNPAAPTGLLEQAALLVRAAEDGRRLLFDAFGEPVGFSQPTRCGWFWPLLEVREHDQSPLVCTIRRRLTLWPRYEVRDAEGELVGELAGGRVFDRWLHLALRLRTRAGGGAFFDEHNALVARWDDRPGESRLEWPPGSQDDPFTKMLVLAALLVR